MALSRRALLAIAALSLLLEACSGGGARDTTSSTRPSVAGCPKIEAAWRSSRPLREFVPASRAGLWLPNDRCVYLVSRGRKAVSPLWRGRPREHLRGLSWAPDGKGFAVTAESRHHRWRVVLVRRDGTPLQSLPATGAAYFDDGRLAVSGPNGIYLVAGSRRRLLASRRKLEHVAGFRLRRTLVLTHDPWGFERGFGRGELALTLWSRVGWKSVVVVSAARSVTRASPAYRTEGIEGVVSGWAWSTDGRKLFVMAEVAGSPARRRRGEHDHCLDIWSEARGRRRAFCESDLPKVHQSHFSKLAWSADATRGVLNNGTVVARDGEVIGRAPTSTGDVVFELQSEPPPRFPDRRR
jgi:hypothetical protein